MKLKKFGFEVADKTTNADFDSACEPQEPCPFRLAEFLELFGYARTSYLFFELLGLRDIVTCVGFWELCGYYPSD